MSWVYIDSSSCNHWMKTRGVKDFIHAGVQSRDGPKQIPSLKNSECFFWVLSAQPIIISATLFTNSVSLFCTGERLRHKRKVFLHAKRLQMLSYLCACVHSVVMGNHLSLYRLRLTICLRDRRAGGISLWGRVINWLFSPFCHFKNILLPVHCHWKD